MILLPLLVSFAWAEYESKIVAFECDALPELSGWERELGGTPGAERWVQNGWFFQSVNLPPGWNGPHGDADFYRISLDQFAGIDVFFVEWRTATNNPNWLLDLSAVPVVVSAGGSGAVYHTTITTDEVQLYRRTWIPLVFVEIIPNVPHVYRLELRGTDSYAWFIDGILVEAGIPLSSYPDTSASLIWGAGREYVDATTAWDFVRAGVIPENGSGDFDSDGGLTLIDQYFIADCLTKDGPGIFGGPGNNAGPGCRFADFDTDSDVDLLDFAEFQNFFRPS